MRILMTLFLLCMVGSAAAQTAHIDRIELTGYGIVTNAVSKRVGIGPSGIPHNITRGDHIETTTNVIPLCLGTGFGMRFRIVGAPAGALADIVAIWRFPPPGLAVPGSTYPAVSDEYTYRDTVGSEAYQTYTFDHRWELVPGTWTLEIWNKDRRLASHDFTVVRRPRHHCGAFIS